MAPTTRMATVYGITNCNTVRSARSWLEAKGIAYAFHDYKKEGIQSVRLQRWCDEAGWERVINRSGTTFRKLPEITKVGLDRNKAVALMCQQPSMIRRPVVEYADTLLVGFDALRWAGIFPART